MLPLSDKVKLVNDLIKENRDVTIRQYLEVLAEIEIVYDTTNNEQTKNIIKWNHLTKA